MVLCDLFAQEENVVFALNFLLLLLGIFGVFAYLVVNIRKGLIKGHEELEDLV